VHACYPNVARYEAEGNSEPVERLAVARRIAVIAGTRSSYDFDDDVLREGGEGDISAHLVKGRRRKDGYDGGGSWERSVT